ncbi:tRNA guanosine(15) transglycosylase TgtA [Halomicrobium mukohataei]|uniref:tRNA-guanine(15) transglycosylase n=1 Tax=Halomicrobium mukohataei TaxID=57705 RepID=A0A847TUQ8_9EURY|nr:tRNA guanosine(15) transglycosylase TgtA [Halomicrobium mukohataei]NLV09762.1 tRNA guanosine(15) transglycosylase TgtA [Halomicrobium mukohataei]
MRDHFEVGRYDAAGRLGELTVPRAGVTVETPALLPVVNPHVQTIEPSTLASEFGAEILITNSYILHQSDDLREPAEEQGLHELLDFPGAIMTDSGSFQLAEYGEIDVTTEEILAFQQEIGSDIGTPVDIPTPPDVARERAESELATTQERLEIADGVDTGEMLTTAPIQGSTYPDLRERAAEHAHGTDLDVFPVGAVVPLMNEYRYDDLADVVAACKRGLGEDAPVHLFGAGHPMMFAMAVALGCDLFDSAAYALYARDGRYLTVRGTEHLDDMEYFPCSCPVCVEYEPADLRAMDDQRGEDLLARHNLHVTYGEIRTIKQAIRDGDLMELVDSRARAHPTMLDGYRTLLDHSEQLEETDRITKDTVFHTSTESARRPEVVRHHQRLDRFDLSGEVLLTEGERDEAYGECWQVTPPFGPYPREMSDAYPFTAEVPERLAPQAYEAAADGVARLAEANPEVDLTLAHFEWPESALVRVPDSVTIRQLGED